jgi:tetratricopeptide (TPR) repeat protein
MRKLLILIFGIGMFQTAIGCGNEYGYTLSGKRVFTRYFYLSSSMRQFDTTQINQRLEKLNNEVKIAPDDFKVWSNISVSLMKLGQADSALQILKPLYEKHPDEYNIIANIGTSYELIGELDSALKYISLGYKLNSNSHLGSEWIHVSILKAKLKERQKPGWLRTHRILDVADLVAKVDTSKQSVMVGRIDGEIAYQIRTRVPFTPAPNNVISNLLVSLGDFNYQIGTYENALLSYTYALEFESSNVIKRKIKSKIRTLNHSRNIAKNVPELSPMFIKMMNRSRIDPEILLMGIDDYANQLDSIHLAEIARTDSIQYLNVKLDSLSGENQYMNQQHNNSTETIAKLLQFLWIGGMLLGAILVFILIQRFKND